MKLEFNQNAVNERLSKRIDKAQFSVTQQVLKDSNYYCPEDVGTLQTSGVIGSEKNTVIWDIEYAQRQYYEDNNKSKDINPNASMKWFEVAKANNSKTWEKIANDKYNE